MAQEQPRRLSQAAFAKAKAYIFEHGRPLDQRLFAFHFDDQGAGPILAALHHFQNEDGGFGHGLEPDVRTPASSAIATAHGFALLRAAGATSENEMVRQAVAYCLATYDRARQVWTIVPPAVEDAPHAPWWTYATLDFGGFLVNPFAEIVAHLNYYGDLVPSEFLAEVTAVALQRLAAKPIADMHDFYCYAHLAAADTLPLAAQEKVRAALLAAAANLVETDPAKWPEYNMKPLDAIGAPDHFLAPVVDAAAVQANLDYLVTQQLDDGSWPLAWSWDFVDAAAWQQAEKDWKGHIAVNNLRLLRAFDRID